MSMRDRLNQRAEGADSEPWKPTEPGEMIEGKLLDRYTITHPKYEPADLLIIETEEGPRGLLCSTVSLRRELEKWEPQIGERVGVLFKGTKEAKISGNEPTKIYLMEVERQGGAIPASSDADALGYDDEDGAQAPF